MGVDNFTGLHLNVPELRFVRSQRPEALILVRFYLPRWPERDPREWARECAAWVDANGYVTNHYTPANEMNLPAEGGGWTPEWYARINEWLLAWEDEFRRLIPDAILHWPALAQGHYEDGRHEDGYDLDWAGYEICRESIQRYDVMDVHPYWRAGGQGLWDDLGRWYAWRFVHDRPRFYPDKPVFISECGNFAAKEAATLAEIAWFTLRLYDFDWVLGATPFIWDSGPEHEQNIWYGNDCLINGIAGLTKPTVEVPEVRPPEPPERPRPRYEDLVGKLVTRGEYGKRSLSDIRVVIVHHTVSYLRDERELIERIARYHTYVRGWPGIGYHYCIGRDGTVYRTNPAWVVAYHARNDYYNDVGVGVAFLGNYETAEVTDVQLEAARNLIRALADRVAPNLEDVLGHRDVAATLCPGRNVYKLLPKLREVLDA